MALLATGLALVAESGATAAPTNASSFDVALLVRLEIGPPPLAGELRPSVTLVPPPGASVPGHVDRAGNWRTDAGVTLGSITDPIDRASDTLLAQPLDEVRLSAPGGLSGTVDPSAHTIDLHAPDATFTFVGNDDPGNDGDPFSCTSVPAPIDLTSVDYDADIGIAHVLRRRHVPARRHPRHPGVRCSRRTLREHDAGITGDPRVRVGGRGREFHARAHSRRADRWRRIAGRAVCAGVARDRQRASALP